MIWKGAILASKVAVFLALVTSLPSTIYHHGKYEGLAVSLALVTFYFMKGFAQLYMGIKSSSMKSVNRFLHLLELPIVLVLVYLSLWVVPRWTAKPYELFLLFCNPVFIILEGASCMLIIQYFGQIISYGIAALVFFSVYSMPEISIISASLCSGAITLCLVLTLMTVQVDQGIISDSACLFLYISYNVWMLSKEWTRNKDPSRARFLSGYSFSNGFALSSVNLSAGLGSLLQLFSVEIAASLIFRLSAFVLSSKIVEKIKRSSNLEIDEEDAISFSELLNAFGKCIVIMVYTHSWIDQYEPNGTIDYEFWRWINIFISICLYYWNLKTPLDPDVLNKTFELDSSEGQ